MKKIWIPVLFLTVIFTGCSGEETSGATESKAQVCKEGEIEISCELKEGIASLRNAINEIPHFSTDTVALATLIDKYNLLVSSNNKTVEAILQNEKLSENLSAIIEAYNQNKQLIDSLNFKASVMEQLEAGSKENHVVVSLSAGKQKHPIVFLKNKSKKYFHTATFQLKLVTREKQVIKDLIWVQNTNGFEPAAFGAVFPPYFSGENKTIPLYEKLSEAEIKSWDSTELKLINITW